MIMAKRLLTITADDFGYCPERNRGVVECYIRGGITRASVLINGEAALEASVLSKKHSVPLGESVIVLRILSTVIRKRAPQAAAPSAAVNSRPANNEHDF